MTTSISTSGIQQLLTSQLLNQQSTLAQLNEQLSSGQQNNNLTSYTPSDATNLMDFQNAITQRQAYISSIKTVQSRLSVYNSTMSDMESITQQAQTLSSQNASYDSTKVADIQASVKSFLSAFGSDLNQQIGGRYIYAGSRYNTPPVVDLTTLTNTPTSPYTVSGPTLPVYDTAYTGPGSTSAAAYAQDSVNIDNGYTVQYGVTSNATGFQQVIAGLQLMNVASQPGNSASYQTDMTQANTLLTQGLASIQTLNAGVANNINTLTTESTTQNTDITNLQNQITGIQSVDTTTVATEITLLQTQLQASYSATGSIEQLSIVKYL